MTINLDQYPQIYNKVNKIYTKNKNSYNYFKSLYLIVLLNK